MLPSFDDYFHANNLIYQLIPSKYTDDQSVCQSDWTSNRPGHTPPKLVNSDLAFPWWQCPCTKNKLTVDSSNRILRETNGHNQTKFMVPDGSFPWWLTPWKKMGYWLIPPYFNLIERILGHNSKKKRTVKRHINTFIFFGRVQKPYFGRILGFIHQNGNFSDCLFLRKNSLWSLTVFSCNL